jgi:hypothetical protein
MASRLPRLFAALALLAAPACANPRHCVPDRLASSRELIDLCSTPDAHAPAAPGVIREVAADFRRRGETEHPAGARPYQFLALSGGGLYGAFGVGVLCGWTDSGTRPQFDVVTGISTGALIATYAFLGPQYDGLLRQNLVGTQRSDILTLRCPLAIPFASSIFTAGPLERKIAEVITPEVLGEVARAHAAGRRLYVGTTALDSRRLIIWDMGTIASRGTPEALDLYRTVVLASSSIPVAFPPVRLPVTIEGCCFEELHVDGGVSDEVIFRAFMVGDLNRLAGTSGAWAPPGSTLYIVSNGKLYSDPNCVRPRIISILSASFSSILYGKYRDELYRIYMNCLATGVGYRLVATPRELPVAPAALSMSREDQERLFESGYRHGRQAATGEGWRDAPAGIDPSEQALPRAGTHFASPGPRPPEARPSEPGALATGSSSPRR